MKKKVITLAVWLILVVIFLLAYQSRMTLPPPASTHQSVTHPPSVQDYEDEEFNDYTSLPVNPPQPQPGNWIAEYMSYVPLIIVLACLVFFVLRYKKGVSSVMDIRRSTVRRIASLKKSNLLDDIPLTFQDVGGCEEAKATLREVVDYFSAPGKWEKLGIQVPRGILLEGPPGCGKTRLAKALAGESKAAFFEISAAEFVELFVGVGAARVRATFELALKSAPAVLFIDELDAIGRRRGSGLHWVNDEREQTLNQLLSCLDGFTKRGRIVVLAATNRADVLDRALLRPGRFDKHVSVPLPSIESRKDILGIHLANRQLSKDVNLPEIARICEGYTGADLALICEEAMRFAFRKEKERGFIEVTQDDLSVAVNNTQKDIRPYSAVDGVMIESSSQMSRPSGNAHVRITLCTGQMHSGKLSWADSNYIKLTLDSSSEELLLAKRQVLAISVLSDCEFEAPFRGAYSCAPEAIEI